MTTSEGTSTTAQDHRVDWARRRLAAALENELDGLVDAVFAACRQDLDAYADVADPEALADTRRGIRLSLLGLIEVVGEGTVADIDFLDSLRQVGARHAARSFPATSVVRASQVEAGVVWAFLADHLERLEVDADVRAMVWGRLGSDLMRHMSKVSDVLVLGMQRQQSVRRGTADQATGELIEALLHAEGTSGELEERVRVAGHRLGSVHAVALVVLSGLGSLDRATVGACRLEVVDALQRIRIDGLPPLVRDRAYTTVAVVPAEAAQLTRVTREIQRCLDGMSLPAGVQHLAVVGHVEPGVGGIAQSWRQAKRTLVAARELGRWGRVVEFTGVLPSLLLMAQPGVSQDLWDATLGPVRGSADGRGEELVHTLDALFEERWSLQAAAARLHVHRHTLSGRIRRIEALTGTDLQNASHRLSLWLGMFADRLRVREDGPGDGSARRPSAR